MEKILKIFVFDEIKVVKITFVKKPSFAPEQMPIFERIIELKDAIAFKILSRPPTFSFLILKTKLAS